MRDYFKAKTWFITTLMFIIAFGLSLAIVYYEFNSGQDVKIINASSNDNVSGWVWNSNIGWISFNSTNCDTDGNGFIDTDAMVPGCGGDNTTMQVFGYGVNIDPASGDFSGYAWSNSVGWISFNRSDAGNPPANPYKNGDPIANYNSGTGKVNGWAKIRSLNGMCVGGTNSGTLCPSGTECTGGGSCQNNGWIKFNDSWTNGVSIDSATGEFSGWAWNANDDDSGIGWLSFNCSNETPACSGTNYKVTANVNRAPTATDLTAPNWSYADAAGILGALNAKLSWTFSDSDSGASESAYQIIINTNNNTNNPVFDSGKCLGANQCEGTGCVPGKCKVDNGASGTTYFPLGEADGLVYNIGYYWWVKVWDDHGVASSFTQYNSAQDIPSEADDGVAKTFTTYKHKMPIAGFTHFPDEPSKGEQVKFTNTSQVYLSSAPNTAVNCTINLCEYEWTATAGASINDVATTSPIITFNSAGNSTVTLKVTDKADRYYVSVSDTINVNSKLPKWKEVKSE